MDGRVPSNFGDRGDHCIRSPPSFVTGCHFAGKYGDVRAFPPNLAGEKK